MFKTSKEFKLAVIIAVAVAVVGFCAARIILFSSSDSSFERGYGFRSWERELASRDYAGPWSGRWSRYMTEAEREAFIESGRFVRPTFGERSQMFGEYFRSLSERSIAAVVLLVVGHLAMLALCVLGLIWLDKLIKRVNVVCEGDGRKTAGVLKFLLLGVVTFGIYNLLWLYMLGDRLQDNARRYNLTFKEGGAAVLLWFVPGMFILAGPFISLYIVIKNTNALDAAYNKGTV